MSILNKLTKSINLKNRIASPFVNAALGGTAGGLAMGPLLDKFTDLDNPYLYGTLGGAALGGAYGLAKPPIYKNDYLKKELSKYKTKLNQYKKSGLNSGAGARAIIKDVPYASNISLGYSPKLLAATGGALGAMGYSAYSDDNYNPFLPLVAGGLGYGLGSLAGSTGPKYLSDKVNQMRFSTISDIKAAL